MTITTGIAIYGAVLSTVGVGWNFYNEWKEKKKAADEEVARRLELRRQLFVLMQGIPCIGAELVMPWSLEANSRPTYNEQLIMLINSYLGSISSDLTALFSLPEAQSVYNHTFKVVPLPWNHPEFDEAMKKSYEEEFLPLQNLYLGLEMLLMKEHLLIRR